MRKKQPSKQAYARHVRGQSGSSSSDEERRNSCIDGASEAVDVDKGKLASLPLRVSFSNDCEVMVAVLSILRCGVRKAWPSRLGVSTCKVLGAQHVCVGGDARSLVRE